MAYTIGNPIDPTISKVLNGDGTATYTVSNIRSLVSGYANDDAINYCCWILGPYLNSYANRYVKKDANSGTGNPVTTVMLDQDSLIWTTTTTATIGLMAVAISPTTGTPAAYSSWIDIRSTLYTGIIPSPPIISEVTETSCKLVSAGATCVCNGQEKPSGSIWTGLNPGSSYTAYAYQPATSTYTRSANSSNVTVTTLINTAPIAENVAIEGTPIIGTLLTGRYDYLDNEDDVESGTTFQWYRENLNTLGYDPIPGATGITYRLTNDDNGKHIKFAVRPQSV